MIPNPPTCMSPSLCECVLVDELHKGLSNEAPSSDLDDLKPGASVYEPLSVEGNVDDGASDFKLGVTLDGIFVRVGLASSSEVTSPLVIILMIEQEYFTCFEEIKTGRDRRRSS